PRTGHTHTPPGPADQVRPARPTHPGLRAEPPCRRGRPSGPRGAGCDHPTARAPAWRGRPPEGPLPAGTLFTPKYLDHADAVLAMYHDQGLPVLKHKGFGQAVNITLGLPIIRTSVDHGTALDLAGTGRADVGSLRVALHTAISMIEAQGKP